MKTTCPTTAALIAEALAKKGATKVPTGATNGMTNRDWYKAARDPDNRKVEAEVDEAYSEREREVAMAHGVAGLNDLRVGAARHGRKAMVGR